MRALPEDLMRLLAAQLAGGQSDTAAQMPAVTVTRSPAEVPQDDGTPDRRPLMPGPRAAASNPPESGANGTPIDSQTPQAAMAQWLLDRVARREATNRQRVVGLQQNSDLQIAQAVERDAAASRSNRIMAATYAGHGDPQGAAQFRAASMQNRNEDRARQELMQLGQWLNGDIRAAWDAGDATGRHIMSEAGDTERARAAAVEKAKADAAAQTRHDTERAADAARRAEEKANDEKWRERNYGQRDRAIAAMNAERGAKRDDIETEREQAKTKGLPVGFEVDPRNPASDDNKKKFTEIHRNAATAKGLTDNLRGLLAKTSKMQRLDPTSPEGVALRAAATKLDIAIKNVAELGALSGPDMGLVKQINLDPTSIASMRDGSLEAALHEIDQWGDNAVEKSSSSYGVRRSAGGSGGGDAKGAKPVGAPRRDKKTGKLWQLFDDGTAEEVSGG